MDRRKRGWKVKTRWVVRQSKRLYASLYESTCQFSKCSNHWRRNFRRRNNLTKRREPCHAHNSACLKCTDVLLWSCRKSTNKTSKSTEERIPECHPSVPSEALAFLYNRDTGLCISAGSCVGRSGAYSSQRTYTM